MSVELNFSELERVELNAGFRIINDYITETDIIVTRIDVKIEDKQYAVAFISSYPVEPKAGQKISPLDDLITPKKSIERCLNLKVGKDQFIGALKKLISDIES